MFVPTLKRLLFFVVAISAVTSCKNDNTLFEKLNENETNIHFNNKLIESPDFNVLDYLYYYNGAGTAAGDINNDGLPDLFFVSNQGKNKLYLNKGTEKGVPKFEDISAKAGIEGFSNWKTGVSMADVNGDGLLDIYVCAITGYKHLKGQNELFINNGDNTFTEKSKEYGLNFEGFSTQASFFDYDKDGDLDCYLLNFAPHGSRSYDRVNVRMLKEGEGMDILFKNENGKFVNANKESKIDQTPNGFGLGVSVADINNDGWEDIYVSNDFHEDDLYLVNQKDGTYKDELRASFDHQSRYSRGTDIADINNDGFQDIFTLDLLSKDENVKKASLFEDDIETSVYKKQFGYFEQVNRNCLQLNQNGKSFIDIAPMAGVMATDWSWGALLADFDNDGYKDIFVSNGIKKRLNNLDFLKFVVSDTLHYYNVQSSSKLDKEAIDMMPDGKTANNIFKGNSQLKFSDETKNWGFEEKNYSNGSIYVDLDNDGDLDLVTNNINESAGVYLNNTNLIEKNNFLKIKLKGEKKNTFGIGAKVYLKMAGITLFQQIMPSRGFLSSVEPNLTFGLGKNIKIDSIIVLWESQKIEVIKHPSINKSLELKEINAKIDGQNYFLTKSTLQVFEDVTSTFNLDFIHHENAYFDFNREMLMPFKISTEGPKIAIGDINNDGLDDFYVGGAKYQKGAVYLQKTTGFERINQPSIEADSVFEDVDAIFFDADNDKDIDLYVVSGGNEFYGDMSEQFDRLYLNNGSGSFINSMNFLPKMFDNKSCVRSCDFDRDGDQDLFVGGRVVPFKYGSSPKSYILQNNGKGHFDDITKKVCPDLLNLGMVTDAIWIDTDHDGDKDLTVIGDWMAISTFENQGGKLKKVDNGLNENLGFWQCLTCGDFDKDGDLDLVVGNLGTNTIFESNPLKMYLKDIDKNQTQDQIIAEKIDNKWYPINSKDEYQRQMPEIMSKKFQTYRDFAGKTISEIFGSSALWGAEEKTINTFETVYLENIGHNKFKMKTLPPECQISKVMSVNSLDVNKDGNLDILMGGNFDGGNIYHSKFDAFKNVVLLGDGKGRFKNLPYYESGFYSKGNVRDIKIIKSKKTPLVLVAKNNDKIQIFKTRY